MKNEVLDRKVLAEKKSDAKPTPEGGDAEVRKALRDASPMRACLGMSIERPWRSFYDPICLLCWFRILDSARQVCQGHDRVVS